MQGPVATDPYRIPADYYPAPDAGIDIKQLLAILRRRRWTIISTMLIVTALAVLAGLQLTPKYTAKAMVMIDPQQQQVVTSQSLMQALGTDSSTVESQIRLLKARQTELAAMEGLNLFDDSEFNKALLDQNSDVAMRVQGPLEKLLSWLPDEWLIATGLAQEAQASTPDAVSPELAREAALDRFDQALKVTQEGKSYVMAINFTSASPQKAADIANKIASLYVQGQLDTKKDATDKAADWLSERLQELQAETEANQQAVEQFRVAHGLAQVQGVSLKEQRLYDLNHDLSELRAEYAADQAKIKLIKNLREQGRGLDSIPEVLNSATIIDLRQREAELLREESELLSTFGSRHPRVQNLRAEKASLERKIQSEVGRIMSTIANQADVTASKVKSLETQIHDVEQGNSVDREAEVKLSQLQSQADASKSLYQSFLQRYKEMKEQTDLVEADSQVISQAAPPAKPSTPGPLLFGAVGFTASTMLGTLLALLLEKLDSGMRSAGQIESGLGLAALGLVPRLERLRRNQKPHQYLIAKPLSAYAEAIRSIYTSMQLSDVDNPPKVVLVTSSLPQEGKTTLAVSLAAFAARSNQRVLLMDLDLRHPSIQRELGCVPMTGYVEYMAGEKTLDEVIQRDDEVGLFYFPVKRQPANPTDLLGSQRMRQLIAELRERYDYVVIDSAPLIGVTDTKVAALLADKVIFATQWDKTTKDTATNGLNNLREVKASIAGAVLTQVDVQKHAEYGYGDVGQYYGKYQKYYVN